MGNFKHIKIIPVIILLSFLVAAAFGAPPRVIKAVPENGAQDVNPRLREIRIVFDQDMERGFSICGSGPNFPEAIGKPRWINKRTIVKRVRLVPNHKYQMSINCPSYKTFRNTQGEPVEPYPIEFRTGSGRGRARTEMLNIADNKKAIEELRRAIDEDYSYRELRKVNWDELFDKYSTTMKRAKTARRFAEAAAELLAYAEDMHIRVKVDDETVGGFKRSITRNYNIEVLEKTVPGWQRRSDAVFTGRFKDGVGYILIDSWSRSHAEALEQAYVAIWEFAEAPGLIIDVRSNGGGAEPLAQKFAGCFIGEPKIYAQQLERILFEQGLTFGIRKQILQRSKLAREFVAVQTEYGEIRIKTGTLGGEIVNAKPEFSDCRLAAEKHNVSVKAVLDAAIAAYKKG